MDPTTPVDLVYAVGHLHVGGLSLDLYDDETGELICHSVPKYGTGDMAGDDKVCMARFGFLLWTFLKLVRLYLG